MVLFYWFLNENNNKLILGLNVELSKGGIEGDQTTLKGREK